MGASTPENRVKSSIKDALMKDQWMVQANLQTGFMPKEFRGRPDFEAYKDGKVLFIEVKAKNGKQSYYQKEYQKKLEEHGMIYVLARSVSDIEPYLTTVQSLFPGS